MGGGRDANKIKRLCEIRSAGHFEGLLGNMQHYCWYVTITDVPLLSSKSALKTFNSQSNDSKQ